MGTKYISVGQSEWAFPEGDIDDAVKSVKAALENSTVAELQLVDGHGRPVTVCLNGRTVDTVTLDLSGTPRPSEIS